MNVSLTLRSGGPARPVAAWFVPGEAPARWLEELAAWPTARRSLRLHPVPRGREDHRPLGALVAASDELAELAGRVSPRCLPYARVAGCLFIPVDAEFSPPVSEAELRELLADDATYVWHPVAGLTRFEAEDVLGVADLLSVPPAAPPAWDRAEPGVAFARRLISLLPEEEPTVEMIFRQGQDDIGADAEDWDQLPPAPREPKAGPLHTPARKLREGLARAARWFAQKAPAGAAAPTWINRVEQWASRQLAQAALQTARNKQLSRLLHMLEANPDEGLRYALPLGGDAHRGLASAGGGLQERSVDFDLSRLGGGRAADFWDVSQAMRVQLAARYRQLANREIRLGRHRRAAYIFAELLGDHRAAANALSDGGHWREAAALYRDRLKRPREAAECLQRGGLWLEAVALYEELGDHERAGDLYRKLDDAERAEKAYRQAVRQKREANDLLGAAALLDAKLASPREAVEQLAAAWPDSAQAGQCLREMFRILGREGEHDAARRWIEQLRAGAPPRRHGEAVEVLAHAATRYPDRDVQHRAADATRALVARRLPQAVPDEVAELMGALRALVPEDRLLGRDCFRYRQRRGVALLPAPKPSRRTGAPELVRTFQLAPAKAEWRAATWIGETIVAAGFEDRELVVTRCDWAGDQDKPLTWWPIETAALHDPLILAADPRGDRHLLAHSVGRLAPPTVKIFAACRAFPTELAVGSLPGLSRETVAVDRSTRGATWMLETRREGFVLAALGPDGELIGTELLGVEPEFDELGSWLPPALHARGDNVYVGVGRELLTFNRLSRASSLELPHPVVGIAGSAPNTRARIAVSLSRGGLVFWDDFEGGPPMRFAGDLTAPTIGFNRGGLLIAADDRCWEVYRTRNRKLRLAARLENPPFRPLAILAAPRPDQFGLLSAEGEFQVCAVP